MNQQRPNVVVFFTDQQRWDTLGVAGNPLGLTPNLDLMARHGTLYEVACTTNPVCAPARAALQTGLYPTNAGVYRNSRALPLDAPTLARRFKAGGYQTAYIGKWHLGSTEPVPVEEQGGYDYWLAANLLEFTSDAYRTVVFDREGEPVFLPGYRSDALVDAAIRYVARASTQDQPFLLFLSLIEPHHQNELDSYPAPEVYRDTYTGGWLPPDLATLPGTAAQHTPGYYGQVKRVDEGLGRLRDALRSLDLSSSTVLLYTSDHGSHFKTRNAEYKRSPHDGSVRVPLVIEGPGHRSGARVRRPVSTVDVVPTLMHAAGLELPDTLDGTPLRLDSEHDPDDGVLIQISETEVGRALRTSRWKYHVTAVATEDEPAAEEYSERSLYDLAADPYELENLVHSPNYAHVSAELRRLLLARIKQIEGSDVTIVPAAPSGAAERHPETRSSELATDYRILE